MEKKLAILPLIIFIVTLCAAALLWKSAPLPAGVIFDSGLTAVLMVNLRQKDRAPRLPNNTGAK